MSAPRKRRVVLLGSTGSIGTSTLKVAARTAGADRNHRPRRAPATSRNSPPRPAKPVSATWRSTTRPWKPTCARCCRKTSRIHTGAEGLVELATLAGADIVLVAIVGTAGLHPALAAIEAGKDLAMASKEILVMAGEVITAAARKRGRETAARGQRAQRHLPMSRRPPRRRGGGFPARSNRIRRPLPQAARGATRRTSLRSRRCNTRPGTWGPKITIDSATLFNKGLEMIEARWLFDIGMERIDVVVHPQSIIHSMVEFTGRLGARPAQPHGHVFPDPIRAHLAGARAGRIEAAGFPGFGETRIRSAARRRFPRARISPAGPD